MGRTATWQKSYRFLCVRWDTQLLEPETIGESLNEVFGGGQRRHGGPRAPFLNTVLSRCLAINGQGRGRMSPMYPCGRCPPAVKLRLKGLSPSRGRMPSFGWGRARRRSRRPAGFWRTADSRELSHAALCTSQGCGCQSVGRQAAAAGERVFCFSPSVHDEREGIDRLCHAGRRAVPVLLG